MSSAVTDRPMERRLVPVYTPASIQDRVVARIVDFAAVFIIAALGIFAVARPLLAASRNGTLANAGFAAWVGPILYIFGFVLFLGWSAWWASTEGKSLGRAAVGLSLIDEQTNQYLSLDRVIKRQLVVVVELLSAGIVTILSFMKLTQSGVQSQALHDQLIGSRVARVEARETVVEHGSAMNAESSYGGDDAATIASGQSSVAKSGFAAAGASVAPSAEPTFTEALHGVQGNASQGASMDQATQNFATSNGSIRGGAPGVGQLVADPNDTMMQQSGVTRPMATPGAVPFDGTFDDGDEATEGATEPFGPPSNASDQAVSNFASNADAPTIVSDPLTAAPQRLTEAQQIVPVPTPEQPTTQPLAAPQTVSTPWQLVGESQSFTFTQVAVVGREPVATQSDQLGAELITMADAGLSVSKSHAMVGRDTDGIWVRDLGSRNGTFIAPQGGSWLQAMPGDIVEINQGDLVRFGHQQFTVR